MAKRRQAMRDYTAEDKLFLRRAFIAVCLVAVVFGVLLLNMYQLQIVSFEDYQTRADGNRIKVVPIAPNRGLIYDRNGVLLAENRPSFSLRMVKEQIRDIDETVAELSELLVINEEQLQEIRDSIKNARRFQPVTILDNLNEEQVAKFSAQQHRFSGMFVEAGLTRYYPYADALTHVLGYIAKINDQNLESIALRGQTSNYAATRFIGKQGIERYYEDRLHGSVGYKQVEVDNKGRELRVLSVEEPIPGEDLVLNIDVQLQLFIQSIMREKRGSVVVSEPSTGQILAMFSNPSYDPNLFVRGISQKAYNKLIQNTDRPLLNRAVQGQYPPASLIKPHLALLGLEYGVISENTKIHDPGYYQLPDVSHRWRDWKKTGHGHVDVKYSIEVSCDTFFYELAYKLGIDTIHEYMTQFGFGLYTEIDLAEETDGNMPSRGWKQARFNQPWYIGDTISIGIGQGYWTATPIQLLNSLNTLLNDGVRHIPQILRGSLIQESLLEQSVSEFPPISVLQSRHWEHVRESMRDTVGLPHGTAYGAYRNAKYSSGGKTGTAQLFTVGQDEDVDEIEIADYLKDNAMYFGYAPVDTPEISVMVALENAGGGGSNAAPLARQVMDYYLVDRTSRDATIAHKKVKFND
ncbi:MAG: penicillin-binding protein 2 [Alteromonadaceae bacterium]|nr:penicillin-binding protein 2 [Alteromonadaceae bacterium]